MSKKKWKKKYKALRKDYDALWCGYVRLKSDDERIKIMTDDELLRIKDSLVNLGKGIVEAFRNINH